jgi:PAS domain S-box-containing protein
MNLETGYLWGNAAHQALYGRTMEDPVPQPKEWLSRIHPADRESVQRQQEVNLRSAANTFITEYRFRNGQEEYRHIYDRCYIIRNAEGKPVRMLGSMMDVTTLKQTEVALRRKGEQLQTLGDNLPGTMIYQRVREMDGRVHFSYLSREVESLTGKKAAEVVEHPEIIYALILEEDKEEFVLRENESFEKMSVFNREVRVRDYRGNIRWLNVRSIPRKEPDGRIIWDGVLVDITEQKTAAEKISKERNLSDSLIDSLPGIFYLYAKDGTFLRWNTNFETVSGYTAAEIAAIHPLDFYQGDEKELLRRKIENVFLTGEDTVEAGFLQKSGNRVPYFFTGRRIFYNEQECLMGVGIDVTERVKAQQEIREANKRLRQLTTHLQTIREEERKRIGREIHDELGQQLTAIKMDVAWLNKKFHGSDEKADHRLKDLLVMLDETVKSVRRISSQLRPSLLDDLGLTAAMEWQLGEFEKRAGIKTSFSAPHDEIPIPEASKTALFRIFQESLTNVVRHAAAKKVSVELKEVNKKLVMSIADNGKGFDPLKVTEKKTLGILGMKERSEMVGGTYEINSKPGEGTSVIVSVPVSNFVK